MGSQLTLRDLTSREDFERAVELQCQTWGRDCGEIVPPAVLMLVQKIGGVVVGAFEPGGELVGVIFGVTGVKEGSLVHWSHLAAVRENWRDRGVGQTLKREQRRRLRAMGVERALWSFDPLVARNANLNLNRLGARVLEYLPDLYGVDPKTKPDTVIGSDRFLVEWDVSAEDAPEPPGTPKIPDVPTITVSDGSPPDAPLPAVPQVLVEIPADIQTLKKQDPELAKAWRRLTRRAFQHYLASGYRVARFVRDPTAGGGHYVVQQAERDA
jgi:predicted GNAT superfamily acetyltransferase